MHSGSKYCGAGMSTGYLDTDHAPAGQEPQALPSINRMTPTFIAVAMSFMLLANAINAQVFPSLPAGNQVVHFGLGLDPAILLTVGYAQSQHGWVPNRSHILISEIALPFQLDLRDYRLKFGVQSSVIRTRHLDVSATISVVTRGTVNSIHRATNFGTDVILLLGCYGRFGSLAGEIGLDKGWLTHIRHSNWYRTYIFSNAKDGWYANTASTFHYGLRAGLRIGRAEIIFRAGINNSGSFSELFLPLYAVLGLNYHFLGTR